MEKEIRKYIDEWNEGALFDKHRYQIFQLKEIYPASEIRREYKAAVMSVDTGSFDDEFTNTVYDFNFLGITKNDGMDWEDYLDANDAEGLKKYLKDCYQETMETYDEWKDELVAENVLDPIDARLSLLSDDLHDMSHADSELKAFWEGYKEIEYEEEN